MTSHRFRSTPITAAVLAALALGLGACGGSETDASDTVATTGVTTATLAPSTSTTSTTSAEETTSSSIETTPTGVADADLPGEAFDIGPGPGSVVAVVAVAADDVLNIRALPDASSEVLAELEPTDTSVELTGRKRLLNAGIWWEVQLDGAVGWANSRYLAPTAATTDATAALLDAMGARPTGSTADDVVAQVIAHYTTTSDEPTPEAVIADGPTTGDLTEVIVDVVGYPDDAVLGERLHLFIAQEGDTFALTSVEATTLCRRGSDGEFCV